VNAPLTLAALGHLKVRHLRLLDLLARRGTLHRAAAELHISQPAATGMLNDIEALFGVPLFTRSRQGVALSPAGAGLLGPVRTLLNEFEALQERVDQARAGGSRTLRIGAVPHVFAWLLPRLGEELSKQENIVLYAIDGHSSPLLDLLIAGKLDCVIGRVNPEWLLGEVSRQIHFEPLYEENMVFIAGASNPILKKRKLGYQDLLAESWVLPVRASTTRRAFIEAFLRHGLTPPDPKLETSSFLYNLTVAATSSMLTLAPRTGTLQYQEQGQVAQLRLPVEATPMAVNLITRVTTSADPTIGAFVEAVRREARRVSSPINSR
jgi:DNA-binding transcriptional LysR family regulator